LLAVGRPVAASEEEVGEAPEESEESERNVPPDDTDAIKRRYINM
jgi:hypothetical protein